MTYGTKLLLKDANGNPIPQYWDVVAGEFKPMGKEVDAKLIGSILTTQMKSSSSVSVTAGSTYIVGTFVPSDDYKDVIFAVNSAAWTDATMLVSLQGTIIAGDYTGVNPTGQHVITWASNIINSIRQSNPVNLIRVAEYRLRIKNDDTTDRTLYQVYRTERRG